MEPPNRVCACAPDNLHHGPYPSPPMTAILALAVTIFFVSGAKK
ncbi:MAG: hypothetical protein RQ758_02180 [Methanomicrobiaceae archaeon]|nr:hypothetical protein [Methanomicrobiaceae archaeon]